MTYASSKSNIATISKKGLIVPKRKGKTTIRATVIYKKKAAGKEYTDVLSYPLTILGKSGRELYCARFCQTPEGRRVYTGKVVESIIVNDINNSA